MKKLIGSLVYVVFIVFSFTPIFIPYAIKKNQVNKALLPMYQYTDTYGKEHTLFFEAPHENAIGKSGASGAFLPESIDDSCLPVQSMGGERCQKCFRYFRRARLRQKYIVCFSGKPVVKNFL